ncbi:asparagine--tRNA ligase, partial [bacterium]|nr:asparagine--tRNA ligase [bacterium]
RELEMLERDTELLARVQAPFPRVTYSEMVELLGKNGIEFEWGSDFGAEHETVMSRTFDRPFLVTHFPRSVKPFYMEVDPEDERLTLSVDMLAPEGYGEIVGGGQRVTDLATLERSVDEGALPRADYEWYIDLRRFGSVPHGGFGLGLERVVAWICGIHHLRETIPFPRMLKRLRP